MNFVIQGLIQDEMTLQEQLISTSMKGEEEMPIGHGAMLVWEVSKGMVLQLGLIFHLAVIQRGN